MSKKLLLYNDTDRAFEFRRSTIDVANKANLLASVFVNFQPWKKTIETLKEFEALVSDPVKFFDDILLKNVDLKFGDKAKPDPDMLASLFKVDRINYIRVCQGDRVEAGCIPCQRVAMIKPGDPVLTSTRFGNYKDYLDFENGKFIINDAAIEAYCEKFKIYCESPRQIETQIFWKNVTGMLNDLRERNYLAPGAMENIPKSLGDRVRFNYVDYKFYLNEEIVRNEILKLQ